MHDMALRRAACCALALGLLACSDDDPVGHTAIEGTAAYFDLDVDYATPATFYDFPFPSDLRRTESGAPDYEGIPVNTDGDVVATVFDALATRPAFSMQPVGYFRFDAGMAEGAEYEPIGADAASAVLLVDIDPGSPYRGTLYPTSTKVHAADDYNPENLLAVGAYPGIILPGDTTYAFVLKRDLGDAAGAPLGVSEAFVTLRDGGTPSGARGDAVVALYAPLWETLDTLSIDRAEVAAATVFTVGDVVRTNLEISDKILAAHDVTIENVAVDPDDGAAHTRFCELHATIEMPFFQKGEAPYNLKGEGLMDFDSDGAPVQVKTETVPIAITLPNSEMPEGGYPLMYYIHGSGGVFAQGVDRGRITTPGGVATKGEGPAYVVAEHGIASVMAAMPQNPDRNPGAGSFDYVGFVNYSALPYNFRQGTYEQRLIIEALTSFSIDPSDLGACTGPTLPAGETAFRFRMDAITLMGQSMGATYAHLLAAIEPRIGAMAPSGAGAWNGVFLMESPFYNGTRTVVGSILGVPPEQLSHLHPGVHMVNNSWEMGDPYVALPRINLHPFEGHPARHHYTPVADGDDFYPPRVFNMMAVAMRSQQAGEETWTEPESLQSAMSLVGTDGFADYPVVDNRSNEAGDTFTSVVVQYEGDGVGSPHSVFSQLDEIKYQYGCLFASYLETGTATVPEAAPLGTACP